MLSTGLHFASESTDIVRRLITRIQSRSFPFWSPTGLSNCGHFLCRLSCGDVEKGKSATKITVRECAPRGLLFTLALNFGA